MSETFYRLFFIFLDVILPLIIGYNLHKYKIMSINTCNLFLKINLRVFMTITAFGSFWLIQLNEDIFLLSFVGIILCSVIPGLLAYPYGKYRIKNIRNYGAYLLSSMLSNTGILGGLCVYIAMGQLAYAYVQVIAMAQNIFTFTVNFPLAEYFHQKFMTGTKAKFQPKWRSIFISWNQIALLAIVLGIVLNLLSVPRPDIFDPIFNTSVHLTAWFGILPVGYLLNFKATRVYKYIAFTIVPVRFFIILIISYFIASYFTDDKILTLVITFISMCPIGINSVIITQLYNLNTSIAQAIFIITTIIFLFLIYPLFLFFI